MTEQYYGCTLKNQTLTLIAGVLQGKTEALKVSALTPAVPLKALANSGNTETGFLAN